jgi:adenosylmethionine-8-amino-7-oxononanoate aminotransferase
MSPYCYRCPYNRAQPQAAEARTYRQCQWECISEFKQKLETLGDRCAAVVIEPRVQGAAGFIMHPHGYLEKIAQLTKASGTLLIADEVLTGFGRTGAMLASHHENVQPDLIALAKGLTGGYLPMAATLVRQPIVDGFRGSMERALYHGHSYSGNQLGCVAALANLEIFEQENVLARIKTLSELLRSASQRFWQHPQVGDIRQEGLILAIELVQDRVTRESFPPAQRIAWHINERARAHGLLTRGLNSTLFLLPPYSTSPTELELMLHALDQALWDVLPRTPSPR